MYYEVKVNYQKKSGEENPSVVKETYLVNSANCSAAEQRVLEEIEPYVFGELEMPQIKKRNFHDIFPADDKEQWFEAKVELIIVDLDKETRKAKKLLIKEDTIGGALHELSRQLDGIDAEIVSIAKSPILELL